MKILDVKEVHATKPLDQEFKLQGWVRSHRAGKGISFIEFSDGTSIRTLQLVVNPSLESYQTIAGFSTSTLQSLRPPTPKAPEKCFESQPWTWKIFPKSITRSIFSRIFSKPKPSSQSPASLKERFSRRR